MVQNLVQSDGEQVPSRDIPSPLPFIVRAAIARLKRRARQEAAQQQASRDKLGIRAGAPRISPKTRGQKI